MQDLTPAGIDIDTFFLMVSTIYINRLIVVLQFKEFVWVKKWSMPKNGGVFFFFLLCSILKLVNCSRLP